MSASDWIKLAILLPVFLGLGPLLGLATRDNPRAQRWIFAVLCFMTVNGLFAAGNWGLTLASVETYRGHAKGYHFYFNLVLAIALLVATAKRPPGEPKGLPPGMGLYFLFVFACSLSVVNAPRVDYTLMALHKMVFFSLIAFAAARWLRGVEERRFLLVVLGFTLCWQAGVVLKMKYLDGMYQVRGTFEHQNPLAMYAVLAAMPLLAVAMGPEFKGRGWCTAGFVASAIIVQGALSRAALLMFAVGTVGVVLASLVEKPTRRRLGMLGGLTAVGALGLMLTLDTIVARFGDRGNTASSELRDVLNEAARRMHHDHPLGIGWNNYALCINVPYPYAEVVHDWIRGRGMRVQEDKPNAPVESHYYLLLGENGYPGLLTWLLLIAVGLWRNLRALVAFPHGFDRCLSLGLLAGFGLNYVQSTLERVLTQPRNLMLWLILYGLTARLEWVRRARRAGGAETDEDRVSVPVPSATAACEPARRRVARPPPAGTPPLPRPDWLDDRPPAAALAPRQPRRARRWRGVSAVMGVTVLTLLTLAVAWRARQARVMIVNEETGPLPALRLRVGGVIHEVPELAEGESHRWILIPPIPPAVVELDPSTGPDAFAARTRHALVTRGSRLILHVDEQGVVEETHSRSVWMWFSKP